MTSLRPWLRNSLIAAVFIAAFLVGTPFLLQKLFSDWLLQHGGEQVSIRNIDFNPLLGTFRLESLELTRDKKTSLSVEEIRLKIAWLPLLDRQVTVQEIHLSGFSGTIDTRNDRLSIGGIVLPQSTPDEAPESEAVWTAGIRQLSFNNINMVYLDKQLQLNITLDELVLGVLEQWSPDTPAKIRARGSIDGAAFTIKGEISPFASTPRYQTSLSVKQLPLAPFAAFAAPTVTQLAGTLSFEGSLDLALSENGPQYEQRGTLTLEALKVGLDAEHSDEIPMLQLARLEASDMLVTPELVSVGTLHHSGLVLQLHINEQGELDTGKQPAANDAPATEQASTLDIAINKIVIDTDSMIHFSDDSVKPPFKQTIGLRNVVLQQLDTRKPSQQSTLSIDASFGNHGNLKADGWVQPFLDTPGISLKAIARAIGLPPMSSYTQAALGLKLDSGTLDLDLDVKSQAGKLDGQASVKLHQLTLENVESENSLQDKLPVPINMALSTLRDSNNTIELDIPFSGDTSNPEFDVSDAIGKAVADGLSKGAMTYLTLALQPYGAILTVAKYANDSLGQVRLQAVSFSAADASLQTDQHPYLDKVAGLLKKRSSLTVRVCGVGVQKDLPVPASGTSNNAPKDPRAILEALAQQRADLVMTYLVDQAGVSPSQLVHCAPRAEPDDARAEPRTELLL
ncbi:hypothetical protein MNBD_GAMMA15-1819 [hydrothermal vent metagenome]|uniref:OmpA-like domain-containing protein n=1 Tax=hydrothermal vent metagenome TaxID=652676 RepID=A0A3B0ZC11_9ZZZZ